MKAECEGLVPADAGPGFILSLDGGDPSQLCTAAQPDEGEGTLPLGVNTYDDAGLHRTTWSFYRASDSSLLESRDFVPGEGPSMLLAQPQGFTGLSLAGQGQFELRSLDHLGADVATVRTTASGSEGSVTAVPAGGTIVLSVDHAGAGYTVRFERYDGAGKLVADSIAATGDTASATQRVKTAAGASVNGDTLVVFNPGDRSCGAVWLDSKGQKVTPVFSPAICPVDTLATLLDGSLLIQSSHIDGSTFLAGLIGPRETATADLPQWMAGMSLEAFFLLPGARGYAARRGGLEQPLEVFSPTGLKCGELTTPELQRSHVLIGRDGTLVEQDLSETACTFRWYPQLFKE